MHVSGDSKAISMDQINFRFELILLVALLDNYDRLQYSNLGDQKDFQSKPLRRVGEVWCRISSRTFCEDCMDFGESYEYALTLAAAGIILMLCRYSLCHLPRRTYVVGVWHLACNLH